MTRTNVEHASQNIIVCRRSKEIIRHDDPLNINGIAIPCAGPVSAWHGDCFKLGIY